MAAGNRSQNAFGRDSGAIGRESSDSLGSGLLAGRARGLTLPIVLGVLSAIGLLLSYLEIGPTSFRIAIFSCIIAGFVAALFQRRSLTQVEQVVAEERQARLSAIRDLRDEMAALRDAVQGARGPAVDFGPLRAELASLSGKVGALEQSQSTFRDSLVQEMNPGRGRRRGRTSDSGGVAAGAAANGWMHEAASYVTEAYEPHAYEPAYATSTYIPLGVALVPGDVLLGHGSGAVTPIVERDRGGCIRLCARRRGGHGRLRLDRVSQLRRRFRATQLERGLGGRRGERVERRSQRSGGNVSSNPYNDAFAYAGSNAFESVSTTAVDQAASARSALWESSAASRLASAGSGGPGGGGSSPAGRTPWGSESGLPSRPAPGGRAAAASWEPQSAQPQGRTAWSDGSSLGDDEDPAAAAARHGSPRRGRPSDEDPLEVAQTQRLSASEQTAIRRRFLDLSSMEDDGWSRRR